MTKRKKKLKCIACLCNLQLNWNQIWQHPNAFDQEESSSLNPLDEEYYELCPLYYIDSDIVFIRNFQEFGNGYAAPVLNSIYDLKELKDVLKELKQLNAVPVDYINYIWRTAFVYKGLRDTVDAFLPNF